MQHIPNFISLSRIVLSFVSLTFLHSGYNITALIVFTLAVFTDFYDGHWARKLDAHSSWGIFLDPLADKILVHSHFLYFWWAGFFSFVPVFVILLRDFWVTILRLGVGIKKCQVSASLLAKIKTGLQFAVLFMVFFCLLVQSTWLSTVLMNVVLYLIAFVAVISGWGYVRRCILKTHQMSVIDLFWWTVATGFGSGFSSLWPGTMGSLVTVFLWAVIPELNWGYDALIVILIAVIGFFAAQFVSKKLNSHDPSCIVVDEFLGMWITLCFVPKTFVGAAIAFGLFRFFDVLKPFPISWLENFSGAWGIMLDDIAAAFCTIFMIFACQYIFLFLT